MFPKGVSSPAFFSNASGAIRKNIWKKIKYNEKTPFQYIGGEDQILAKTLTRQGYKIIYEPRSIVYHSHRYSSISRLKEAYLVGLKEREIRKWEKEIFILDYSKKDLVKYLIKKRAIKELIFNLILTGILMRLSYLFGKIKQKSLKTPEIK